MYLQWLSKEIYFFWSSWLCSFEIHGTGNWSRVYRHMVSFLFTLWALGKHHYHVFFGKIEIGLVSLGWGGHMLGRNLFVTYLGPWKKSCFLWWFCFCIWCPTASKVAFWFGLHVCIISLGFGCNIFHINRYPIATGLHMNKCQWCVTASLS